MPGDRAGLAVGPERPGGERERDWRESEQRLGKGERLGKPHCAVAACVQSCVS